MSSRFGSVDGVARTTRSRYRGAPSSGPREHLERARLRVAGAVRRGGGGSRPSGVRSSSTPRISAPDMPSTAEWWIFVSSPTLPSVEAVDQVQLPQRPRAVERAREDPRHLLGDLLVGRRRRDRQLAHVVLEVEVRIVDPVRVVEPERHRASAASGTAAAAAAARRSSPGRRRARAGRRGACSGRAPRARRRALPGAGFPAPGTARQGLSAAASVPLLAGESTGVCTPRCAMPAAAIAGLRLVAWSSESSTYPGSPACRWSAPTAPMSGTSSTSCSTSAAARRGSTASSSPSSGDACSSAPGASARSRRTGCACAAARSTCASSSCAPASAWSSASCIGRDCATGASSTSA